jgi:hypothetical protein
MQTETRYTDRVVGDQNIGVRRVSGGIQVTGRGRSGRMTFRCTLSTDDARGMSRNLWQAACDVDNGVEDSDERIVSTREGGCVESYAGTSGVFVVARSGSRHLPLIVNLSVDDAVNLSCDICDEI